MKLAAKLSSSEPIYLPHNLQLFRAIFLESERPKATCTTSDAAASHQDVCLVCRLTHNACAEDAADSLVVTDNVELAASVQILGVSQNPIVGWNWWYSGQNRFGGATK